MNYNTPSLPENFFMVGINYKNTDATTRGQFSVSEKQYEHILQLASAKGVNELFILSTCNRTEIYGFAKNAYQLMDLLCTESKDSLQLFCKMASVKNGLDAVKHLYHVGAGLDSQILGDYEIVGQLRQAIKFSRDLKRTGTFLERLVNSVLQASKKVKTDTLLSSGSVSVSFSTVKYIREKTGVSRNCKILVLGAGKIGRNTCRNLVGNFDGNNVTVINRSPEKAIKLAAELKMKYAPINELYAQVNAADIVIVATNATSPVILKSGLNSPNRKTIIDLSIPCNVEDSVRELRNVTLIHVDQVSKLKDENLKKREAEVPKAKKIIALHLNEFMQWYEMRKNVPVLKAIKSKLREIHKLPRFYVDEQQKLFQNTGDERKVQQVINGTANKLLRSEQRGCHYLEAINEYMAAIAN